MTRWGENLFLERLLPARGKSVPKQQSYAVQYVGEGFWSLRVEQLKSDVSTFTHLWIIAPLLLVWLRRAIVPRRRRLIQGAGVIGIWLSASSVTWASVSQDTPNDESSPSGATTSAPSHLRSAEDGWPDLSNLTDQSYGFAPW